MPETILVAEDQIHIRALIEYKLKNSGYNVISVSDGATALAKSKEAIPDLVLLDVMMPMMNGFEVLIALKEDDKTKHIPVLMVTAQSREEEIVKGLELGADDYITKPFSPNELAARVKTVLIRHKKR
jgi:two-component system phosphate regulon response regulator PhoB